MSQLLPRRTTSIGDDDYVKFIPINISGACTSGTNIGILTVKYTIKMYHSFSIQFLTISAEFHKDVILSFL